MSFVKSNQNLDICNGIKSFKVYDNGGAEGNYSDGCTGYLLLQAPIG